MYLDEVQDLFDYWRKNPPIHEFAAAFAYAYLKWRPSLTVEEQWDQGAMNPEEFAAWVRATGGREASPGG